MSLKQHEEQYVSLSNNIQLCYSSHGNTDAPTILLIAGLGLQMVYWPAVFIEQLTQAGFRVLCVDNRDAGKSSRCDTPYPKPFQQILGKAPAQAYTLEDMAMDMSLFLEALNIEKAHIVGMSMGGMIGQVLASHHASQVASLVSIFSTTGNRKVGQPAASTLWLMANAKKPFTEEQAVDVYRKTMEHIGDPLAPNAANDWQEYASAAWLRNGFKAEPEARYRQIGAILKSADRSSAIKKIAAPTLVIHGDVDHMVHPSGGKATASNIVNAKLEVLQGLRHQIDTQQSPRIAKLILSHIQH